MPRKRKESFEWCLHKWKDAAASCGPILPVYGSDSDAEREKIMKKGKMKIDYNGVWFVSMHFETLSGTSESGINP